MHYFPVLFDRILYMFWTSPLSIIRSISIYQYRKTKEKLYKTNVAVWYNKICREKQLAPNYIYPSK